MGDHIREVNEIKLGLSILQELLLFSSSEDPKGKIFAKDLKELQDCDHITQTNDSLACNHNGTKEDINLHLENNKLGNNASAMSDTVNGNTTQHIDASCQATLESDAKDWARLRSLCEERGRKIEELSHELETLRQSTRRDKRLLLHQLAVAQGQSHAMSHSQMLHDKDESLVGKRKNLIYIPTQKDTLKHNNTGTPLNEAVSQSLPERKQLPQTRQVELESQQYISPNTRLILDENEDDIGIDRINAKEGKKGNQIAGSERKKDDVKPQVDKTNICPASTITSFKSNEMEIRTLTEMRDIYTRTLTLIKDGVLEYARESRRISANAFKREAQMEKRRIFTKLQNFTCIHSKNNSFSQPCFSDISNRNDCL